MLTFISTFQISSHHPELPARKDFAKGFKWHLYVVFTIKAEIAHSIGHIPNECSKIFRWHLWWLFTNCMRLEGIHTYRQISISSWQSLLPLLPKPLSVFVGMWEKVFQSQLKVLYCRLVAVRIGSMHSYSVVKCLKHIRTFSRYLELDCFDLYIWV